MFEVTILSQKSPHLVCLCRAASSSQRLVIHFRLPLTAPQHSIIELPCCSSSASPSSVAARPCSLDAPFPGWKRQFPILSLARYNIYIIYTLNLGLGVAVSIREREQDRFKGSTDGAGGSIEGAKESSSRLRKVTITQILANRKREQLEPSRKQPFQASICCALALPHNAPTYSPVLP